MAGTSLYGGVVPAGRSEEPESGLLKKKAVFLRRPSFVYELK